VIRTTLTGQWGNQMFTAVAGCIVSERTGQPYPPSRFWFDKNGSPLRWKNGCYLPPPSNRDPYRDGHGSSSSLSPYVVDSPHWIDLDSLPKDGRDIVVRSYAQRYELWAPYADQIRDEWLKIQCPLPRTDEHELVVHLRRTDYVKNDSGQPTLDPARQCLASTSEELDKCLAEFPQGLRILVCTDDALDPFVVEFCRKYRASTSLGTLDQDFLKMVAARYLLISQSTYSWLAGFLGRAERIVCPMSPGSHWGRGRHLYGPPEPGHPDFPNLIATGYDAGRWRWVA